MERIHLRGEKNDRIPHIYVSMGFFCLIICGLYRTNVFGMDYCKSRELYSMECIDIYISSVNLIVFVLCV
jgi:hypothetical protein